MGLANFTTPWAPQCMLCAQAGDEACTTGQQPCWCVPEGELPEDRCCPDPGERPLFYEFQVADAHQQSVHVHSARLRALGCQHLPIFSPTPPSAKPFPCWIMRMLSAPLSIRKMTRTAAVWILAATNWSRLRVTMRPLLPTLFLLILEVRTDEIAYHACESLGFLDCQVSWLQN
jgi:hypothetical protein